MRKKIVAANWKMNKTLNEVQSFITDWNDYVKGHQFPNVQVVIAPPFPYLTSLSNAENISISAQNCSQHALGAYTGEVSASMLKSINAEYCIIGHSERRQYFGEDDTTIASKLARLNEQDIIPILCVGETLEERNAKHYETKVQEQLEKALEHFPESKPIIIAYEPVWAIGTGKTATTQQAQDMHLFIRKFLIQYYSPSKADSTSILYGGSCNAGNAAQLFSCPDIDGGLIGGASLNVDEFVKILNAVM